MPVKLPRITHLQFLVLSLLVEEELSGGRLRALLAASGVRSTGPQFYQMMSRVERAGLVEGRYSPKEIEHQVVNERKYRISGRGQGAWQDACDFYASHSGTRDRVAPEGDGKARRRGGAKKHEGNVTC